MEGLKKKILLDMFVNPFVIVPMVAGVSMIMLSQVAPVLSFFGFVGVLTSVGVLTTNIVFNYNHVAERAIQELLDKKDKEKNQQLDRIALKLKKDKRAWSYLHDLRTLYDDFKSDIRAKKISESIGQTMLDQIDDTFDACVHSLDQQYDLLDMASKVSADIRQGLLDQREKILQEVSQNVTELAKTITHVRTVDVRVSQEELEELRGQLARNLKISKQLESVNVNSAPGQDVIDKYKEYQ
jgi:hypothetical protein